jgi:hypothetical protein
MEITKGKWRIAFENELAVVCNAEFGKIPTICVTQTSNNVSIIAAKQNACLIADAGNTAQKCGLMPSELLSQRDLLVNSLLEVTESDNTSDECVLMAMNILAKIKQ